MESDEMGSNDEFDWDDLSDLDEDETILYKTVSEIFDGPGTIRERAFRCSNALRVLGARKTTKNDVDGFEYDVSLIFSTLAKNLEPGEPKQQYVVEVFRALVKTGGLISEASDTEWSMFYDFTQYMYDCWGDPSDYHGCSLGELNRYFNVNSFMARITTKTFQPYPPNNRYPGYAMNRALLVKPPANEWLDGRVQYVRLWNTTEWVLQSGDVWLPEVAKDKPFTEKQMANVAVNYPWRPVEAALRGVDEINFFITGLGEFVGRKEELNLDEDLVERITKSIGVMTTFMAHYEPPDDEEEVTQELEAVEELEPIQALEINQELEVTQELETVQGLEALREWDNTPEGHYTCDVEAIQLDTMPIKPDAEYDWLEAATAPECLEWAAAETKLATDHLDALPQKKIVEERLRELIANEAAPEERQVAGKLYRLQKSAENQSGVFQMAEMNPDGSAGDWRVVIDLGALSQAEGKNYVFVDFDLQSRVLGPDGTRVLLYLSDGGSDLVEAVEVEAGVGLVEGGFRAGPDRLAVCYMGPDHILIQTSTTNGLKTMAGMPCSTFIWKRGTPLTEAKEVYTAPATDAISLLTSVGPPENGRAIINRAIDYTVWQHYSVTLDGTVTELPLPRRQCLLVPPRSTDEHLVVSLLYKAVVRGEEVPAGSILACSTDPNTPEDERVSVVFAPGENEYTPHVVADGVQVSRSRVMLTVTKDGKERRQIMQWDKASRTWSEVRRIPIDVGSHHSLLGGDYYSETFVVSESGLLRPTVSWIETEDGGKAEFYKQPAVFDVDKFQLEQHSAISKDGASVDYVLLSPKNSAGPGKTPTLVTAYGVMGISMMMRHLDPILGGVSLVPWLESGGALAVALVRGGSEKGPEWHSAAQGVNRQKSYDDFIAVAEKLVADGVTSPQHMGVFGASGGGLLAAVMAVQRPDLFGAVVADVPMTDMIRFPLLGMGGAWVKEYGDPSDPDMIDAIRAYSPLHNIVNDSPTPYPPQLVTVSTKDDRVGVGHARKFVAKMKDAGAPDIFLHEDSKGGHNVSDSFKNAQLMSRRVAFLINRLQSKA